MNAAVIDAIVVPPDLGRRERKKLETRDALVRAALDLFVAQGFDATTVEAVTDVVDVSVRTFHRYFPTKEDVLFPAAAERCVEFEAFLEARPPAEPLLDSLRAAAVELARPILPDPSYERRRIQLIATTPSLAARNLHHTEQWSQMVAAHAAARLGQTPSDSLPRLLGACTVAALRAARERWAATSTGNYVAEIDRCFELLADLRDATAAPTPGTPR